MAFPGQGWVLVQPSEGRVAATAGGGGGGGGLGESARRLSARRAHTSFREVLRYPLGGCRSNATLPRLPHLRHRLRRSGRCWSSATSPRAARASASWSARWRASVPRTLSLRLRVLEEEGIVERRTFPEVPPRVEYALTDKGRALVPLIEDMRAYGHRWLGAEGGCEPPRTRARPRRPWPPPSGRLPDPARPARRPAPGRSTARGGEPPPYAQSLPARGPAATSPSRRRCRSTPTRRAAPRCPSRSSSRPGPARAVLLPPADGAFIGQRADTLDRRAPAGGRLTSSNGTSAPCAASSAQLQAGLLDEGREGRAARGCACAAVSPRAPGAPARAGARLQVRRRPGEARGRRGASASGEQRRTAVAAEPARARRRACPR